ncbi:MAG: XRE family transcriptional regulator [Treponema sp.]|nr:XRE family transcriptional regulator [Treponema sp.]
MNADEQIRAIRKSKGMTQQEFATFMEVSSSSIANIENGTREISKAMMKSIVEKCGVNAHWLLTGEGEMFTKTESEKTPCVKDVMVPVLSQKASCGPGVEWNSEQNITEYISLATLSPALSGKVYGFRVAGTSMLGAGIKDGDIVIFDASPDQNLTDGIYVFSLDGDAYCKRLEFDRLANRIKIYSVRVADLEKAELLRTLDSTDEGFAERFQLFGKVFSWVHLAKE